jgi:asparagine N-glycosylation enzyme membrane subunit Stt3
MEDKNEIKTEERNNHLSEDRILEERKKKAVNFFKKSSLWIVILLVIALFIGVYIRSLPLTDHGGNPGLWDVSKNEWTLGPDLDPWLFVRQAETIIDNGSVPATDDMRNVPLGFDNSKETVLLPKMIAWTYSISKLFYSGTTIEFAGAIFPVIMFALTILIFFLFVTEIFRNELKGDKKQKRNIIALISTFFMIVIPVFLPRTIAGIPEKESAGFFFMFLSLYLFLLSYNGKNKINSLLKGISAGIATAMMGLIWGGVLFVYLIIAVAVFMAFVMDKIKIKEIIAYSSWLITSILITIIFSNRTDLLGMITSLSSGLAFMVLIIILLDLFLWNNQFFKKKLGKIKLPRKIITIIVSLIIISILVILILGPGFLIDKIKAVHQTIFKPIQGRWGTTVAENRQPYFREWSSSFGPELSGIPIMLFMFLTGSIVLVWNMLKGFKKKDRLSMTGGYIFLVIVMIFTRYSQESIFNGENFISKLVYYIGILVFFYIFIKIYSRGEIEENKFREIDFASILLIGSLIIGIFSARGSVRTIMVLAPIASIFLGYLFYFFFDKYIMAKKENKMFWSVTLLVIILLGLFTWWTFYQQSSNSAYYMVPSQYNYQWQYAMDWVRENTPVNSVFAHWWDYGYWVQSIGERPTILDGGNAITFWNYWMGRLVLTGDNQSDSLDFLYSHNADYLIIDSTDIGKYGAFSSIGSNENFDRYSNIVTQLMNEGYTQQDANGTTYIYEGGVPIDEDIIMDNGVLLPAGRAGIGGTVLKIDKDGKLLEQPYVIAIYLNKQYNLNIKYIQIRGEFIEFEEGIDATLFVYPSITREGKLNDIGALMYLNPRVMRGFLAQKYILDDPFNKFPNFKIAHTESSALTRSIRSQGVDVGEFVYNGGLGGPIKIWEIEYTGNEKIEKKYLDTDPSKYLSWNL